MKVYILSDYGEYGAEHVHATTNPKKLPAILKNMHYSRYADELKRTLANPIIRSGDSTVGGYNLTEGWGGAMLHIVELE